MKRTLGLVLVLAVLGLSGCADDYSSSDTQNKRYTQCLEAGGSFWTNDTDWGCDMPNTGDSHN